MFPFCNLFKVHYNTCQGYVRLAKKKKLSSMNKSCEKKQQHIVKIFYMWMFCITLKERITKPFVQNWHSPSHLRQNDHDFV
jgi:hypothetical protein